MSRSLFDAGPSVPIPTAIAQLEHLRDRRHARIPASDCSFGLCATPAPRPFHARISPSSTCTQCAASTRASNSRCFFTHGTTGIAVLTRDCSTSSTVFGQVGVERHVEFLRELGAALRISFVHVYGACGAIAGTIRGCAFQR
jgi:hypothetical protein